ncbi:hypothetical protein Cadr_000030694 [Camelus dromedarius]|uniref:Uncharacterized protein n=1 Tax=Camelus dromedarius TaxID=9838 RepID=A0A5N4C4B2_CAMDR|nr:hypothetical protein Cadr_000030694 [Camelus dromedarius]
MANGWCAQGSSVWDGGRSAGVRHRAGRQAVMTSVQRRRHGTEPKGGGFWSREPGQCCVVHKKILGSGSKKSLA